MRAAPLLTWLDAGELSDRYPGVRCDGMHFQSDFASFDAPSQSNSRASPGLNELTEVLALHAAKGEVEDADGSDGATTRVRA